MYKSKLNIKHGCMRHIIWGYNRDLGQYVTIDEVKVNGLDCNCECPVCHRPFVACKEGQKNQPHFKHKSNYDCVYPNEIAMYLHAKHILEQCESIPVPEIAVDFDMRNEIVAASNATVSAVYYHCEPEQYPPLLLADLNGQPTRIILAFEGYYSNDDKLALKREASQSSWDCLFIRLPKLEQNTQSDILPQTILHSTRRKEWIHTSQTSYWQDRIALAAISPEPINIESRLAHLCPLHLHMTNGLYYAFPEDCRNCTYNFGSPSECSCTANEGISSLADFQLSHELRMQKVTELQSANEKKITAKEQIEDALLRGFYTHRTCPICGKPLRKMPGKRGINWLCLAGCKFSAFENLETGEIITSR